MARSIRIPDLPGSAQHLMMQLFDEDPIPVPTLQAAVESYRRLIHETAQRGGAANTVVGDAIAHALQALMGRINAKTGAENLRIIQAAVRFFVIQDDGAGHDLKTADGLNDDARVVNAILCYFGRDDLQIRHLPEFEAERRAQGARRRQAV